MNQTELLDQFILEARDCLEQVGQRLLDVERAPRDEGLLNDLFRLVHTLKGNCGLFEFKPMERVVHAGEDLLDRIRNGKLAYGAQIADALLEAMDFTVLMVEEIERTGTINVAAEERSQVLSGQLRMLLEPSEAVAQEQQAPALVATASDQDSSVSPPQWIERIPSELIAAHPQGVAWRYVPEPECFFKGEDPWLLAKQAPAIVHMDVAAKDAWPALDELDCYRCNVDLVGLSDAPLAYVEEHFRCVPEQVSVVSVASILAAASGAQSMARPDSVDAQDALKRRALEIWRDQMVLLAKPGLSAGALSSVRMALRGILLAVATERCKSAAAQLSALPASVTAAALRSWALTQDHLQSATSGDDVDEAAELSDPNARLSISATGEIARRSVATGAAEDAHQKVLKVGQEKIDRLMDLIGEMVVAKNALPYLAQRAETVFAQRELAREIKAQYAVINRIAEDMQYAIMQVRMMPVGTVFQRFGRLVRDISKKLGKEVRLVVEGEETEADKNIIEALSDPLIHIIRNSLDHGIELPHVRHAAGKSAQGVIRVVARQESDRVIIEIHDDGAGIDPQRVRDKAVERGLIPEDKASTLSDTDAVQLIFLPGFSTADAVSDLSGRGVGMDVVRTAVERVNGHVELGSTLGEGTRIRLSLPLSMAVTNVMIIEAGNRRFGVPMDLIVETVRVHTEDIHHFKQARTTVLRGKIVPLRALHGLLAIDDAPHVNEDGEHAVIVLRLGGETVGLLVDHFHGATDIILKPLEGVLAGITGFAGTALMGDGSVLMVLNPKELM